MDIVPDSEPSRMADGSMSSFIPASRVPILADNYETVPESSGETDNETSGRNLDHIAQDTNIQAAEPETEKEDDPMDSDQPLVKRRAKRPPKPILEEEEEDSRLHVPCVDGDSEERRRSGGEYTAAAVHSAVERGTAVNR